MYADKKIIPRDNLEEQLSKRKEAIKMLLDSIPHENSEREGLLDTPNRVANMYEEIFGGYEMNPNDILKKTFDAGKLHDDDCSDADIYVNGMVIVKDIPFFSHCEHHMVPFVGKVSIAYIPEQRVVGLSKLARLVECFARRLQIQERLTNQIADAIIDNLKPLGVMVIIEAEHLCMTMRGVKKPGAKTVTSSINGVFTSNVSARAEALSLIKN